MRRTQAGWQVIRYQILNGKIVGEVASVPEMRTVALAQFETAVLEAWND